MVWGVCWSVRLWVWEQLLLRPNLIREKRQGGNLSLITFTHRLKDGFEDSDSSTRVSVLYDHSQLSLFNLWSFLNQTRPELLTHQIEFFRVYERNSSIIEEIKPAKCDLKKKIFPLSSQWSWDLLSDSQVLSIWGSVMQLPECGVAHPPLV